MIESLDVAPALTLPLDSYLCLIRFLLLLKVHVSALSRMDWLDRLGTQSWIQTRGDLLSLGRFVFVMHSPAGRAYLGRVVHEIVYVVTFFLVLLAFGLLASMGYITAVENLISKVEGVEVVGSSSQVLLLSGAQFLLLFHI